MPYMENARDILARNFKLLLAARPDLDTLPKVTRASGVANGTLDRMRRAVKQEKLDILQELAAAYGLQAWHLLMPGLDPKNPPPSSIGPGLVDGRYSLQALDLAGLFDDRCRSLGLAQGNPDRARVYAKVLAALQQADASLGHMPHESLPAAAPRPERARIDQKPPARSRVPASSGRK